MKNICNPEENLTLASGLGNLLKASSSHVRQLMGRSSVATFGANNGVNATEEIFQKFLDVSMSHILCFICYAVVIATGLLSSDERTLLGLLPMFASSPLLTNTDILQNPGSAFLSYR